MVLRLCARLHHENLSSGYRYSTFKVPVYVISFPSFYEMALFLIDGKS